MTSTNRIMEDADQRQQERRMESPKLENSEKRSDASRRAPVVIQRPDAWSVLGRPTQRLFRVNCRG